MTSHGRDLAKSVLARGLWLLLGRRRLVRLGRFLTDQARLDLPNHLNRNGERLVQLTVLKNAASHQKVCVVDVGANVGDWTGSLLAIADDCDRETEVHLFEPAHAAYLKLVGRFRHPGDSHHVTVLGRALSDQPGSATLHVVAEESGMNSLHENRVRPSGRTETVEVTTLDEYASKTELGEISLVKVDTEGNDFSVLLGARGLLNTGSIGVVQFEYNWRWLDAKHSLRDAFDFLEPFGYSIGKVTPKGIEFYEGWDPELETFQEGNYVACSDSMKQVFPAVQWWKTSSGSDRKPPY